MKKLLLLLFLSLSLKAAEVKLAWDDTNPTNMGVLKYNVWVSTNASLTSFPVTNTSWTTNFFKVGETLATNGVTNDIRFTVTNLTPRVYFFYVDAENYWGISSPSSVISTPPGVPINIKGLYYVIVVTTNQAGTMSIQNSPYKVAPNK
jgi:hypothetical protein